MQLQTLNLLKRKLISTFLQRKQIDTQEFRSKLIPISKKKSTQLLKNSLLLLKSHLKQMFLN